MKVDVYVMFKIKYGVSIMHPIIFSHKEEWFDGQGFDIHP
jgi:hypothetical protein